MDFGILKLSKEDFLKAIQDMASDCSSEDSLRDFEKFLELLSFEELGGENREYYQKVIDQTLSQIDSLLGKHVMSKTCSVEEENEIEVMIENNVVVGFKKIKE